MHYTKRFRLTKQAVLKTYCWLLKKKNFASWKLTAPANYWIGLEQGALAFSGVPPRNGMDKKILEEQKDDNLKITLETEWNEK